MHGGSARTTWVGEPTSTGRKGEKLYRAVLHDGTVIRVGDAVELMNDNKNEPNYLGLVTSLFERKDKEKSSEIQWFYRISDLRHFPTDVQKTWLKNEVFLCLNHSDLNPIQSFLRKCVMHSTSLPAPKDVKVDYVCNRSYKQGTYEIKPLDPEQLFDPAKQLAVPDWEAAFFNSTKKKATPATAKPATAPASPTTTAATSAKTPDKPKPTTTKPAEKPKAAATAGKASAPAPKPPSSTAAAADPAAPVAAEQPKAKPTPAPSPAPTTTTPTPATPTPAPFKKAKIDDALEKEPAKPKESSAASPPPKRALDAPGTTRRTTCLIIKIFNSSIRPTELQSRQNQRRFGGCKHTHQAQVDQAH